MHQLSPFFTFWRMLAILFSHECSPYFWGDGYEPLRSDDFQEDQDYEAEEDFCRFSLITFDLVDGSLYETLHVYQV